MIDATQPMQPQAIDPMQQMAARVRALAAAPNLCDQLQDGDLGKLANSVIEGFDIDKASMADWEERMQRGLDLAMLVKGEKSYPWDKAANIRYPLITSANIAPNAGASTYSFVSFICQSSMIAMTDLSAMIQYVCPSFPVNSSAW